MDDQALRDMRKQLRLDRMLRMPDQSMGYDREVTEILGDDE